MVSHPPELIAFLKDAPIFLQPWWLDAVSPNSSEQSADYLIVRRGPQIAAAMPIVRMKSTFKNAADRLGMPLLTQHLGPWLRPSVAKEPQRLAEQKDLLNELIDQFPKFSMFEQNFHSSLTNWLPFYWRGFQQTTRYTYILDDLGNIDSLWDGLGSNIRREIRKAEKQVRILEDLPLARYREVNALTFKRQGKSLPYNPEFLERLDDACASHQARKIFAAIDEQKRIHAVLYLVWTPYSAYYLMGGGDPELRNSGATSLVMWEAIKFARTVSQRFDFEGSMIEPIERFFRAFGGKQTPYFRISRDDREPLHKSIETVRPWVKARVQSWFDRSHG